jgi:hypothetical protein
VIGGLGSMVAAGIALVKAKNLMNYEGDLRDDRVVQ